MGEVASMGRKEARRDKSHSRAKWIDCFASK